MYLIFIFQWLKCDVTALWKTAEFFLKAIVNACEFPIKVKSLKEGHKINEQVDVI